MMRLLQKFSLLMEHSSNSPVPSTVPRVTLYSNSVKVAVLSNRSHWPPLVSPDTKLARVHMKYTHSWFSEHSVIHSRTLSVVLVSSTSPVYAYWSVSTSVSMGILGIIWLLWGNMFEVYGCYERWVCYCHTVGDIQISK